MYTFNVKSYCVFGILYGNNNKCYDIYTDAKSHVKNEYFL